MFDKEFGSSPEKGIIRLACVVILLGAAAIQFLGWSILGWALVGIGLLTFWLAYLIGTAPCYVEPLGTKDRANQ
jgi:disulfide bond formation protein DsbB